MQSGSRQCAQLLLDERAEVNAADAAGNAALHHAAEAGDADVVALLLDCGRINIDAQNKVLLLLLLLRGGRALGGVGKGWDLAWIGHVMLCI